MIEAIPSVALQSIAYASSREHSNSTSNKMCEAIRVCFRKIAEFFCRLYQNVRSWICCKKATPIVQSNPSAPIAQESQPVAVVVQELPPIPIDLRNRTLEIPADVTARSQQIRQLIDRLRAVPASQRPAVPTRFLRPGRNAADLELMDIPVYAHHHALLDQASVQDPVDGRHSHQLERFQHIYNTYRTTRIACISGDCQQAIQLDQMRINCQLQQEILQFLQRAVGNRS